MNKEVLVIGIGNEYRSDDAAGLVAARELAQRLQGAGRAAGVRVIEQSGEGAALMEAWRGATHVIAIDAAQARGTPGEIFRLDAARDSLPTNFFHASTHAFSLAEGVGVARALGMLPPRFVVYGIQGRNFEPGTGLSGAVREAVTRVAQMVERELDGMTAPQSRQVHSVND